MVYRALPSSLYLHYIYTYIYIHIYIYIYIYIYIIYIRLYKYLHIHIHTHTHVCVCVCVYTCVCVCVCVCVHNTYIYIYNLCTRLLSPALCPSALLAPCFFFFPRFIFVVKSGSCRMRSEVCSLDECASIKALLRPSQGSFKALLRLCSGYVQRCAR